MTRKALLGPLAVVLAAAAIMAPGASAYTEPYFEGGGAGRQPPPAGQVRVVEVPTHSGFQWGDAAIGAGAALAVVLVGLGATLAAVGVRHRYTVGYRRMRAPAS